MSLPDDPVFVGIKKVSAELRRIIDKNPNVVSPTRMAVLDTGLMLHHPQIERALDESVDFTGEGPEDLNGHGTLVALAMLRHSPSLYRFFNVKIMDAKRRGTEEDLVAVSSGR
jgi:hypothetical protein